MNYNTLRNKPTINYKEIIGDNTVTDVGGITEEEFDDLLDTDLASYYTKAEIDELFARSFVYREKSGSIVTFDCPESTTSGITKVTSEIVAVQSGTGDPSPTNARPISGWSAVNVVVSSTTDTEDGTTYTTTLKDEQGNPLTCYGGQLVNENGVQTLDNETKIVVLDGSSDEAWAYYQGGFYIDSVLTGINGVTSKTSPKCMCNMYKEEDAIGTSSEVPNREDYSFFNQLNPYNARLWVKDSRYSTAEDFKTALASQPLQIRYTLATPEEIPQDNLPISTQDGINNLWADSGDITVTALDKIIQE